MKKAKILQISSYPPPRAGWGVRVEFLKKELEATGHDCKVLNLGDNRKVKSEEYECVLNGFDYLYKVIKYSLLGYTIHVHTNGDSPKGFILNLAAEILQLVFGKRCILTFHAGAEQIYFPRVKYPKLIPLFYLLFSIPKVIICNSEVVKAKIIEYGINPDKIYPIPAFSCQYLSHENVEFSIECENFFSSHSPIIFCYIKFRYGFFFETFIKTLNIVKTKYKQIGVLVVGATPDDESIEINIRKIIKKNKLDSNIFETGDMTHDEFHTALRRSSLFLRTPTTDGVCSSVLEALSFKIPVVAAQNGYRPESVITYKADDSLDMANKIIDTIENLELIKANIVKPEIKDTLAEEVELLVSMST